MHYTEYFTLRDCSGLLQIRSHLKAKFEIVSVTMCYLVMSLFSHDFIKTEID